MFNSYYDRKGKDHFYKLLKPHADSSALLPADFIDWGQASQFETAIGVGECAGVVIDLVATLFLEAEEKLEQAEISLKEALYADSAYHSYSAFVHAAKALLLGKGVSCNTQHGIINDFDKHFIQTAEIMIAGSSFPELVLRISKNEPSQEFAEKYFAESKDFLEKVRIVREEQLKPKEHVREPEAATA